ncbi:Os01g0782300, partial [Oryza sativa Japonica Group]
LGRQPLLLYMCRQGVYVHLKSKSFCSICLICNSNSTNVHTSRRAAYSSRAKRASSSFQTSRAELAF